MSVKSDLQYLNGRLFIWHSNYSKKNGNEYDNYEGRISSNFLYFKGKLSYAARFLPIKRKNIGSRGLKMNQSPSETVFLLSRGSHPLAIEE
jgi:hypothetical protein